MIIHSHKKYFLDVSCFPDLVLGAGDREKESAWSCPQTLPEQVRKRCINGWLWCWPLDRQQLCLRGHGWNHDIVVPKRHGRGDRNFPEG